jgi:hypothetical protein
VTLEALLTFFGILLAAFTIASPIQRHSLRLFVSWWPLSLALLTSLGLIICRDAPLGWPPLFGWPLPGVQFGLTLASFLLPIVAALGSWNVWHKARLTPKKSARVEELFKAALREREFDEVERIVRKNQDRLTNLPPGASSVLFDAAMVHALVDSHSLVHLELLSDIKFLRKLENPHAAVNVVVRELLQSGVSPIRDAVIARYGGLEPFTYSEASRAIVERTFQNSEWYYEASAHYPLTISAWEAIRGGQLDAAYNQIGRDYEADQGVSKRAFCPIYLAAKTEVLAIEAALKHKSDEDFYISDLFDLFHFVQERSRFYDAIWLSDLSNSEFPTPYAYLMYEIVADLEDLSCTAVQEATSDSVPRQVARPGRIAKDLAASWSFCIWSIAKSEGQVGPDFRNRIIGEYLKFILKLGWEPSEVHSGPHGAVEGLDAWRDLFMARLKERFSARDYLRWMPLAESMHSLDQGKGYVSGGYDWLEKELHR